MSGQTFSLNEASHELGIEWRLTKFLVKDRQIPTRRGRKNARVLDASGMERLRYELRIYEAKPDTDLLQTA